MGQIKNIKLHIVTDIKWTRQRNTNSKDGSQQSLVLTSSQLWTWFQKVSCMFQSTWNNSQIWTQFVQTVFPNTPMTSASKSSSKKDEETMEGHSYVSYFDKHL